MYVVLDQRHVVGFDNISTISDELSDRLCRFSTGGGFAKRTHHEMREFEVYGGPHPVVINGIPSLVKQNDLARRTVVFTAPTLTTRRAEPAFYEAFAAKRPRLLGMIFDLVSGVLRELPNVKLANSELPMPEFAEIGIALERAAGWEKGTFVKAYLGNVRAQVAEAVETSPIAPHIKVIVRENGGKWRGRMLALLNELSIRVPQPYPWRNHGQPTRWLGEQVRRLTRVLRQQGFHITEHTRGAKGILYTIEYRERGRTEP
jgi:hypothetical protein